MTRPQGSVLASLTPSVARAVTASVGSGAILTADLASVTDSPLTVTSRPEPAEDAGITLVDTTVKGGGWEDGRMGGKDGRMGGMCGKDGRMGGWVGRMGR